jgi:glycosyltransferase involved in cell wall biosynthesis
VPMADILKKKTKTRVETIFNGFDPDDCRAILAVDRKRNDRLEIAYTGTMYKGRQDSTPLFAAIAQLKEENRIDLQRLHVTFAGFNADVEDIARAYGLSSIYSYSGVLSRDDALRIQYNSDIVLFIEYEVTKAVGILSGKLFEYLFVAREIWAIGHTSDISADELIKKCNAGICLGTDTEEIKERLLAKLENINRAKNPNKIMSIIEGFTRENQAKSLLSFVNLPK